VGLIIGSVVRRGLSACIGLNGSYDKRDCGIVRIWKGVSSQLGFWGEKKERKYPHDCGKNSPFLHMHLRVEAI